MNLHGLLPLLESDVSHRALDPLKPGGLSVAPGQESHDFQHTADNHDQSHHGEDGSSEGFHQ